MPRRKLSKELTERERAFITAYLGEAQFNATTAAKLAGYGSPNQAATTVLGRPCVKAALKAEQDTRRAASIASRAERQAFWTAMQRDTTLRPLERLKASELLARSHADFIDRHELTGPNGGPIQVGTTVVHELVLPSREPEVVAVGLPPVSTSHNQAENGQVWTDDTRAGPGTAGVRVADGVYVPDVSDT